MLKIYGSMLCPDCVKCRDDLDRAGVEYEYLDFSDNLKNLKAFLAIRDTSDLFDAVRERGTIGIPCLEDDGGNISLDWEAYM